MKDIWAETLPVRFGDIDRSDRLTLAATFDLFQEVAINHAEDLGVGRDALARTKQIWVLSRMSVLMERRPKYGETITIRSWPRGADRLFAVRDYDIRDSAGQAVVRGRSGWIILDVERRRPLRVQPVIESLPPNEGRDALSGSPLGLETRGDLVKAGERKALFSDIDYNGHVNNARYIQWIQDLIEPEVLEQADSLRLDINYLSEIKYGEVTELWIMPLAAADGASGDREDGWAFGFAVEGRREDNGQAAFRAELRAGKEA
jgi:acyl-ACP thioesterase